MKLISPAPYGSPGLPFGAAAPPPYSKKRRHKGQDHQWFYADPIRSRHTVASVTGTVTAAHNDGGYHDGWGDYVDIRVNARVFVRLAHHLRGSLRVKVGDKVRQGDPIGIMGDTGDAPGGVHLHEELWIDGVRVDPIPYRTKHLPGTAPAPKPKPEPPTPTPIPDEDEDEMTIQTVVGPTGNAAAAKYIYNPKTGLLERPLNGAAESAILRELAKARPEAAVFLEIDQKLIDKIKPTK